ncbi:MAG: MMPL family transporter [Thermoanaerobaculia bacterium]
MTIAERIASAIAALVLRHARAVLWGAAAVAALSLAAATLLRFDPDLLRLVPQENREINEFRQVLEDLGSLDYHVAVVRVPSGRSAEEYEGFVEDLGARIESSPRIANATWHLPDPLGMLDALLPHAFLLLDERELERASARLTDEAIRSAVARNHALLQTPQSTAVEELVRYDPFNLVPIVLDRFRRSGGDLKLDSSTGFYLSKDRSTFLILTRPRRPAQDLPFGRELMRESEEIVRAAVEELRNTAPDLPPPRVEFTGGYAISTADADLIRRDVISNVLFSFFGVLVLFLYGFRRVAAIGYAAIPMGLALAMTFGVAGLIFGTLSSASAGFAALLAGLGIDFNTVLYGRYVDERNRGRSLADALTTTLRTTLPSVAIAASTTAITFFAFLMTDFRGMTQMGVLTGMGILFFFVCVAFVLPALIVANEGGRRAGRAPRLHHRGFGAEKLIDAALARPRTTVAVWAAIVLVALGLATRIRFSDNIESLRASGNRAVEIQRELTSRFGQSFHSMMLVFYGDSAEEALAKTAEVLPRLDALVANGEIGAYQTLASFVPPAARQRRAIAFMDARGSAFDADRIEATFREALSAEGFRPAIYDDYLAAFRRSLEADEPVPVAELLLRDRSNLSARFLQRAGSQWMSVVYIDPPGGTWERQVPPAVTALADDRPDAIVTGVNRVSGALRRIVRADAIRATIAGTAGVLLLMFLGFRRIGTSLLSFVPFLAGAAGMVGAMALLDLQFNFMNVFVGLMIVGVATDYAIYMLKRWIEDPRMFQDGAAAETARSIAMAAVTTVVGYGSFALSHYPGLRSIGYASTFGIGFSALATMTLLPALLHLHAKKSPVAGRQSPGQ